MRLLDVDIIQFDISLYDLVLALWQQCEGIGLSDADSRESINKYLDRNPGMNFVASFSTITTTALHSGIISVGKTDWT